MKTTQHTPSTTQSTATTGLVARRRFLKATSATVLGLGLGTAPFVRGAPAKRQLALGLIGAGGRGQWIANLFHKHGGYRLAAVADYFQDRVDRVGERFSIPSHLRFTGLHGYRRLLEQKVDAVAIISPPYFHPEQAAAAVEAGKHVYLAKPIAVDVPGCHTVGQAGEQATAEQLCFLVDFQTRANAAYQEAVRRVHQGMIGRLVCGEATYHCANTFDRQNEALRKDPHNPEVRLRAWGLDRVLSGDVITEQNIHALDVAAWILDAHPLAAYGTGGAARGFAGTCWDHWAVIFYYPNDIILSFNSKQIGFGYDDICCRIYGKQGTIDTHYFGKVTVRSREDAFDGGTLKNLYAEGAINNIATFYDNIVKGHFDNPTVPQSVRSNLTTIVGRTAAYRGRKVTWDEVIQANAKLEADLSGLKV